MLIVRVRVRVRVDGGLNAVTRGGTGSVTVTDCQNCVES